MGVLHAFIAAIEQLRSLASHIPGIAPLAQEAFLFRPFILLLVLGVAAGAVGTPHYRYACRPCRLPAVAGGARIGR